VEFLLAHRLLVLSIIAVVLGVSIYVLRALYYREKRSVLRDVEEILDMARRTDSWSSRSEFRLCPSLEGLEGELHRRTLFALIRIRKEVWRHYHRHLERDDDRH
jgi:hypothetical protein